MKATLLKIVYYPHCHLEIAPTKLCLTDLKIMRRADNPKDEWIKCLMGIVYITS